jgi:virginiamycin B lyase
MIRLGMHTAAVVMSIAGSTTYAKLAIQTFPVSAGKGPTRCLSCAGRYGLVHRAICGQTRPARPPHREIGAACTGPGVAPHSVIVGPDGSAWSPKAGRTRSPGSVRRPAAAKLNPLPRTGAMPTSTRQRLIARVCSGSLGRTASMAASDPETGAIVVFDALRGTGPYRIATTPDGQVFFASLAGNYLGHIDVETALSSCWSRPCRAKARRAFAPTAAASCGSRGWNSGDLFPPRQQGQELGSLALAGRSPHPYAVYVDENDVVWVND